ncbi:MAG: hypothetical protein LBS88_08715 [Tannerellaceae bacterium]|jgi:hypothetical protein|nr:hypothetical protein [Tannerellaceae bacterium]
MRRIASHSIFCKQSHPLSYIELTDEGIFLGIHPLEEETAATEFYDGLLIPLPAGSRLPYPFSLERIRQSGITEHISPGDKIHLYRLHREVIYRHG